MPWLLRHSAARLLMGQFRYEARDADGLSYEDRVRLGLAPTYWERLKAKIDIYDQTGNQEMLVDAFNYILLELADRTHPLAHFESLERPDER